MSHEPPVPSPLISTVRDALDGRGLLWTEFDPESVVMKFREQHSTYDVLVAADDASDIVTSYCVMPTRIPADRRAAVAEAIMRANYALRYGNFEMDYSDGEVRYRVSVDVEGGMLSSQMVENLVSCGVQASEQYHDAFMRVAFAGAEPEQAVAIAVLEAEGKE